MAATGSKNGLVNEFATNDAPHLHVNLRAIERRLVGVGN